MIDDWVLFVVVLVNFLQQYKPLLLKLNQSPPDRAPTIISLTTNQTQVVGTSYTLICVVDAFPPPLITIRHIDYTG